MGFDPPACPGCRSALVSWATKGDWALRRCPGCGVISADGPFSDTTGLYDDLYEKAADAPASVTRSLEAVVSSMEPLRETSRWLDLGFGAGSLLQVAGARGWACYGTEVSRVALQRGADCGWQVTLDPQADSRFPREGFDVVSMIELLEHLREPEEIVARAHSLLRPGGMLYLTTPNADSLNRRVLGARWSVLAPPDHVTLWTPRGIRRLLGGQGFRELEVAPEGLNPSEILRRIRGTSAHVAANRNEAGRALNAALMSSPGRRLAKRAANWTLRLLEMGDTLKVRALKAKAPHR